MDLDKVVKRFDSNPCLCAIESVEGRKRNARPFSPILIASVDVPREFISVRMGKEKKEKLARAQPARVRRRTDALQKFIATNGPRVTNSEYPGLSPSVSLVDRARTFSRGTHR